MKAKEKRKECNGVGTKEVLKNSDGSSNGILENTIKCDAKGYENKTSSDLLYTFLFPVALMVSVPNMGIVLWYTAEKSQGSFLIFYQKYLSKDSIPLSLIHLWTSVRFQDALCPCVVLIFCAWMLLLMRTLPGNTVYGPVTSKGNRPEYVDNGFYCYIVTIIAFVTLTAILKWNFLSPTVLYDRFDEMIVTLNIFSVIFCLLLYLKGHYYPSTSDSGSSGNAIFDFYWGTELYPRVFGFDVKVFTNCRFGMTIWPLMVLIHGLKSYELHGFVDSMFVSVVLQMAYVTKFFWWEAGYMNTLDIILDRAGFYICWGCMVVVPSSYTSVSQYLVNNPVILGPVTSVLFLSGGFFCIYLNYMVDLQKQSVRATNGECLIWGKKPKLLRVSYSLENGERKQSILLLSGWWGISRHFNYLPEILLSLFWTLPALAYSFTPYFYVTLLTMILVHRTFRDDAKCQKKYGASWTEYCKHVPYKIVPYLF